MYKTYSFCFLDLNASRKINWIIPRKGVSTPAQKISESFVKKAAKPPLKLWGHVTVLTTRARLEICFGASFWNWGRRKHGGRDELTKWNFWKSFLKIFDFIYFIALVFMFLCIAYSFSWVKNFYTQSFTFSNSVMVTSVLACKLC